jgi:thiamine-phosphate pyrophosphorylase
MASDLFLITPVIEDPDRFMEKIEAAISTTPIASLWLRLKRTDDKVRQRLARAMIPAIQARGVAVVVDGDDPRCAARYLADGLHLAYAPEAVETAIGSLHPDRIVGVGGLRLKDEAMTAGELGVDYVMFGEPDEASGTPAFGAVLERVRWWAEVFRTPCVGYAPDAESVAPMAATGAEFVALGPWVFDEDPVAALGRAKAVCTRSMAA